MTTVVIPLYEGVTHLDFTGPHQFLSILPDADVIVASLDGASITSHGLTFSALADLETIERCDMLCIPGGTGCVAAIENARFLAAIRRLAGDAQHLTSVCTGSLILAAAGLLAGRRAACHWAWRDMLTGLRSDPGWQARSARRQRHHGWRRHGRYRFRADADRAIARCGCRPIDSTAAGVRARATLRRRPAGNSATANP